VVLAGRLRAAMDAAIALVLEQAKALGESWA
jgi:hypothetical protein